MSTSPRGEVLGLIFAGYVPLASQPRPQGFSPPHPFFKGKALGTRLAGLSELFPIIVYSVANYRPHLSHFWANM